MTGIWEFIKRHKGKMIIGGAALAGGALAFSQTSRERDEISESDISIRIKVSISSK